MGWAISWNSKSVRGTARRRSLARRYTPLKIEIMYYGSTQEATDWDERQMNDLGVKLIGLLLFFLPRANPDNEKLYPKVRKWLLELNDEGWPQREIALDDASQILFCSPNERNTGMWTDMGIKKFETSELEQIEKSYFEECWNSINTKRITGAGMPKNGAPSSR